MVRTGSGIYDRAIESGKYPGETVVMKLSCACGIFIGFILAVALGGAAFYYFYLKDKPEVKARGVQQVEEKWNQAKETGDRVIETIK